MPVSDVDFLRFYQEPMSMLSAEGDSHIHFIAGYPNENEEREWYEKAMAALTRLGVSGLIYCYDIEDDIVPTLNLMFHKRNEDVWPSCIFNPTESGMRLAEKFHLDTDKDSARRVIFGFRQELGHIFDKHGVGFGVDLPYDKLLSIGSD